MKNSITVSYNARGVKCVLHFDIENRKVIFNVPGLTRENDLTYFQIVALTDVLLDLPELYVEGLKNDNNKNLIND